MSFIRIAAYAIVVGQTHPPHLTPQGPLREGGGGERAGRGREGRVREGRGEGREEGRKRGRKEERKSSL